MGRRMPLWHARYLACLRHALCSIYANPSSVRVLVGSRVQNLAFYYCFPSLHELGGLRWACLCLRSRRVRVLLLSDLIWMAFAQLRHRAAKNTLMTFSTPPHQLSLLTVTLTCSL